MNVPNTPASMDAKHLPANGKQQFQCPQCNVIAQQEWSAVNLTEARNPHFGNAFPPNSKLSILGNYKMSCCYVCRKITLWEDGEIIWPSPNQIMPPSDDMPDDVKAHFNEARSVYNLSPKAAAALLRLAIQHLSVDLGGSGKDLNADIAKLVQNGLPLKIQQALDVVRVIGNNAVHPGLISIDDNPDIVTKLFKLVNIIVDDMITQPEQVKKLFGDLPDTSKEQIAKRDA
jgi:hypothetical protein